MLKIIRLLGCWVIGLFVLANVSFAEDFIYYQDEIVVTALRVPHSKSTLPWQTKVISRREIERSSAIKLGDVLRSVAGVNVKANGWVNSQISIHLRGSKPEQVLVLLNGNRINSPTLGLSDLGNFLLADVERIEIVKAPLTAIYGADAVGGV
ncbi:MAG: TonB-dependent receptor plug domain-containing protein, partial [Candidatus Margulisbacteria bacterium]|nr:TonB-dependent receptor plug domain-containing protein [Candidatus Margulisiibacteriota bacterium]